jgi:putative sterol carrier protein
MPVKFATVDFYRAMADQLNNDPAWVEIGKDLSYSMVHVYTEPVDRRFYAAFDSGKVTGVREAAEADAEAADFVIAAPPDVWRGIFDKTMDPTAALTAGKIQVQGDVTTLLKDMQAFLYVVEAMTKVPFS